MIQKIPTPQEPGEPSDEEVVDIEDETQPGEEGEGGPAQAAGSEEEDASPAEPRLTHRIEAILFASGQVLPAARLARVLGVDVGAVHEGLAELAASWAERPGAIDLVEISGGFRFMTRPAFQDDLAGLVKKAKTENLSPAALETLSVIAYRQPLGRAEIESIRGVRCGPLLRVLLDRDLIRVTGRSPEPGHPLLYGTTKRFLDHFGLKSLKQLPDIKDLLDVS